MNGLVLAVNEVWNKAACHECLVLVAAQVTNAAFVALKEVEQGSRRECDICNPEDIWRESLHLQDKASAAKESKVDNLLVPWQLAESLQTPWRLLLQCKGQHQTRPKTPAIGAAQPSSQIILRPEASAPIKKSKILGSSIGRSPCSIASRKRAIVPTSVCGPESMTQPTQTRVFLLQVA